MLSLLNFGIFALFWRCPKKLYYYLWLFDKYFFYVSLNTLLIRISLDTKTHTWWWSFISNFFKNSEWYDLCFHLWYKKQISVFSINRMHCILTYTISWPLIRNVPKVSTVFPSQIRKWVRIFLHHFFKWMLWNLINCFYQIIIFHSTFPPRNST